MAAAGVTAAAAQDAQEGQPYKASSESSSNGASGTATATSLIAPATAAPGSQPAPQPQPSGFLSTKPLPTEVSAINMAAAGVTAAAAQDAQEGQPHKASSKISSNGVSGTATATSRISRATAAPGSQPAPQPQPSGFLSTKPLPTEVSAINIAAAGVAAVAAQGAQEGRPYKASSESSSNGVSQQPVAPPIITTAPLPQGSKPAPLSADSAAQHGDSAPVRGGASSAPPDGVPVEAGPDEALEPEVAEVAAPLPSLTSQSEKGIPSAAEALPTQASPHERAALDPTSTTAQALPLRPSLRTGAPSSDQGWSPAGPAVEPTTPKSLTQNPPAVDPGAPWRQAAGPQAAHDPSVASEAKLRKTAENAPQSAPGNSPAADPRRRSRPRACSPSISQRLRRHTPPEDHPYGRKARPRMRLASRTLRTGKRWMHRCTAASSRKTFPL